MPAFGEMFRNQRALALRRSFGLAILALAVLTGAAFAQAPATAPAPSAAQDSAQALMTEFQQLQQRLSELQFRVLQERPELMERQAAIDEMLITAMSEIDPEAEAHIARLDELQQEAMVAQQAQDPTTLQTLMTEAQDLQQQLQAAEQEALAQENIQSEIERWRNDVMAAIVEIDPEAEAVRVRLDELAVMLGVSQPGA